MCLCVCDKPLWYYHQSMYMLKNLRPLKSEVFLIYFIKRALDLQDHQEFPLAFLHHLHLKYSLQTRYYTNWKNLGFPIHVKPFSKYHLSLLLQTMIYVQVVRLQIVYLEELLQPHHIAGLDCSEKN